MAEDPTMEALRRALLAEHAAAPAPSSERIEALRSAVEHRRDHEIALPGERTTPPRRWPRVLAAAAVVVAIFVGGVVIGQYDGPSSGDSSELEATRDRLDDLGQALTAATLARSEQRLREPEFAAIARADAAMLDEVAKLDTDEKNEIVPVAHQVHLQAVLFFETNGRELPTAKPSDLDEIGSPVTGA